MVLSASVEPRVALALLCAVALSHAHAHAHDKRAEMSPAPFTFAARYGRSPDRFIAPRNNRWMMTARYGKRSGLAMEALSAPPAPLSPARDAAAGARGGALTLTCRYTGVTELYRCTSTARVSPFERREDEPDDE